MKMDNTKMNPVSSTVYSPINFFASLSVLNIVYLELITSCNPDIPVIEWNLLLLVTYITTSENTTRNINVVSLVFWVAFVYITTPVDTRRLKRHPQTQILPHLYPRSVPSLRFEYVPEVRLLRLQCKLEEYELPEDMVDDARWANGV